MAGIHEQQRREGAKRRRAEAMDEKGTKHSARSPKTATDCEGGMQAIRPEHRARKSGVTRARGAVAFQDASDVARI